MERIKGQYEEAAAGGYEYSIKARAVKNAKMLPVSVKVGALHRGA